MNMGDVYFRRVVFIAGMPHSLGITLPRVMTKDLIQGHSFFQNDHMWGRPEQHTADPPLIWQEITKLGGSDICLEMSHK
jgi:hypothetical protein